MKGKTKSQIFVSPEDGDEALGHEIGHQMNKVSKNPITRFISNSNKYRAKDLSGKELVKQRIAEKLQVQEEKNASKNAMKLIKNSGAPKEEVKHAKDNLNAYLNTYKSMDGLTTDILASKKFEIKPGRHGGKFVKNYHTLTGKRKKMTDLGNLNSNLERHYKEK